VCHARRISKAADTLPRWKVSSQSVQSHPGSRQIGSHLIRSGLASARLQPTGFGRDTPYSSSKRGFCVRETVAVNPQSVRPNDRADVRSHGQSVSDPGPCPVRNRTCPRPVRDRIRVRKLSVDSPCPCPCPRRECPRSGRRPSVNQPCPDTWTGREVSALRPRISV
jgi:hypothetical protein